MKILIAPLNWGLGHATRSIPLIRQYLTAGHEVVLAGDGDSLALLHCTFPNLRVINLPSLELRYTYNNAQRGFYIRAIPALIRFTIADHYYLRQQLAIEHFDIVISDNRFGLFSRQTRCIYITHQLYMLLPKRLKLFQPLARALHAWIYKRYDEVWVPDYADCSNNLAGALAHGGMFDHRVKYIGPLSRFDIFSKEISKRYQSKSSQYSVVAILSGLEPQRTLFEETLINRFREGDTSVLIVRGKIGYPSITTQIGPITLIPYMSDEQLLPIILQANKIIVRSGYSTIMDLAIVGLLDKAEWHPTAGQPEQEYLAVYHRKQAH